MIYIELNDFHTSTQGKNIRQLRLQPGSDLRLEWTGDRGLEKKIGGVGGALRQLEEERFDVGRSGIGIDLGAGVDQFVQLRGVLQRTTATRRP